MPSPFDASLKHVGERLSPDPYTVGDPRLCFLPQDGGTVKCWGYNDYGVLGLGDGVGQGAGDNNHRGDEPNGACPARSTTTSRVPPPRCVLTLAPALRRDGGEPPFGRPGARENGRDRQRWLLSRVRAAGKDTKAVGTCRMVHLDPPYLTQSVSLPNLSRRSTRTASSA